MEATIPKTSTIFAALIKADLTTQWRNRRAVVMVFAVPVVILISWKGLVAKVGGPYVLSLCIALGLISIGLMGYTNSIARDREKGIFQRLRVGPLPNWCIMGSRLTVQLVMIMLLTLLTFITGYKYDNIVLSPGGYVLCFLAAIVGGSVYLSLGQMIVGRINNPESVNSTTRLVYFVFVMVGTITPFFDNPALTKMVNYSPYGTVKSILAASMQPATWTSDTTGYLFITLGYTVVFAYLGIKWFKWK
jgi:ABC-2 type transport system permease protein